MTGGPPKTAINLIASIVCRRDLSGRSTSSLVQQYTASRMFDDADKASEDTIYDIGGNLEGFSSTFLYSAIAFEGRSLGCSGWHACAAQS
jgi:hypothetical protein